ncbi:TPA: hypothetical protein IAB95_02500 [Candidatus Ventrenecus avicola]|nr:hypothetical protein [Candidatus Ventrenecus avicola]
MKKKISILLFVLIGILLFPNTANADLACEGISYNIYKDNNGRAYPINFGSFSYGMYTYAVRGYESSVKAYCIDPMKRSGTGDAGCVRRIDPSSSANGVNVQAYDVAATKAYQILTQSGRNTISQVDRVLGEVVFRWLNNHYGLMSGSMGATINDGIYTTGSQMRAIFNPNNYNSYWVGSDYIDASYARDVYNQAIAVGDQILNGATYEQLVNNGSIWGERYTYTATQETTASNVDEIVVTLTLQNPGEVSVDWSEFTGGCDNTGVICTSSIISQSGNTITIRVTVNKQSGYNGQDYEVYVQTSATAQLLSSANMIIVSPGGGRQNMQLINDSSSSSGFLQGGTKVYVDSTPGTPTGGNHVCEIIDGQHYCNDGQPCSEPEYRKDCLDEPVNCTPTVTMPGDCNNFDVEDEATGIISDINEVASSCNPNVNQVTQCVLGHDDLTSQSYESTLDLSENPYCKVYCKESYQFNMPTAKITRSGGYFTLQTTINATRDCYVASSDNPTTGQGIQQDKFINEIIQLQKDYIDAYNSYLFNKAGVDAWDSVEENREEIGKCERTTCGSWNGGGWDDDTAACTDDGWVYEYNFSYTQITATEVGSGLNRSVSVSGSQELSHEETFGSKSSCAHTPPGQEKRECNKCGEDGTEDAEAQYNEYVTNRDAALQRMTTIADQITTKIRQYNDCSGAISNTNISALATTSPTSGGWNNDMRFDPVVTFNYNQDYMNQMNGTFEQISLEAPHATNTVYCTGTIDSQYNCLNGATTDLNSTLRNINITVCDTTSGCYSKSVAISTANYVQKSKSASATYAPNNEFSTYTQYGTIKLKHESCSGNDCLWSNLPEDALPVSLITQTGVFPFVINYSNIGQSNSTGALGRLAGNSTSVLTEYNDLDPSVRCTSDTTGSDYLKQDAGYVCHYLTNCDGEDHCQFTCDDDNNCEFTDVECRDDHCILTCKNCIFDGESNNFSYRTITLNNLNPNSRSLGFNWSNVKGQATQRAIEEAGETIYESPQYSYTLTPSNLSNIREYNNEAGSYTNAYVPDEYSTRLDGNASLYCQTMDYNGVSDGLTYNCRSRFLDLIESSGNEFATESYRITSDYEEGTNAFESFNSCSGGYGNGECEYIGPSWRIREAS